MRGAMIFADAKSSGSAGPRHLANAGRGVAVGINPD
jgi:hypothetical protein